MWKPPLIGSLLGLLAVVLVHLALFALVALVVAGLGLLGGALIEHIVPPEVTERALTLLVISFFVAFPVWFFGLLLGASAADNLVNVVLPLAGGLTLAFGWVVGGVLGALQARSGLQQRPLLLGGALGLGLNGLALLVLALLTSWAVILLLPGTLCLGPLTGMLAALLVRRFLPVKGEIKESGNEKLETSNE